MMQDHGACAAAKIHVYVPLTAPSWPRSSSALQADESQFDPLDNPNQLILFDF